MKNKALLAQLLIAPMLFAACSKDEPIMEQTPATQINTSVQMNGTEEAFPGMSGKVRTAYLDGDQVTFSLISGFNVLEGDIIIPDTALSDFAVQTTGRKLNHWRWPNNKVVYYIDPDLPDKARVRNAIKHWEENTPLRFVEWKAGDPDYIYFLKSDGCSSSVGRQGGAQGIYLGPDCTTGNAIHEIGHAIGLWHEQARSDRDKFVDIKWGNIADKDRHNFKTWKQRDEDGFDRGDEMNFLSIMMYGPYSFAIDKSKPTITKLDGSLYDTQRKKLSPKDISTVKFMYAAD